jgi:uncharacterized RDD family membrane protein YckC
LSPDAPADSGSPGRLVDFPLREDGRTDLFADAPAPETPERAPETERSGAPLSARAVAFAADLAGASLAVTLAVIAAVAVAGRAPRLGGLPWAAAFALGYSFVFVVLPLTLFGRTVGMSLAGLTAAPGPSGRRLTPGEASRRWAGTLWAAAALGLPLLGAIRSPTSATPADRFSGRPLVRDPES